MEIEHDNLCFDFLKRYGYHLVKEPSESCITYAGDNNRVVIIHSEYSKEIYCQFEDVKTLKRFSLQDALDYQGIIDLKGLYQISGNNEINRGLLYIANAIEKVYSTVDISDSITFYKIYDYTVEMRDEALKDYHAKEELKKADSFWKRFIAPELYKLWRGCSPVTDRNKLIIRKRRAYSFIEIRRMTSNCENTINDAEFLINTIIDYAQGRNIFVFHDGVTGYQVKEDIIICHEDKKRKKWHKLWVKPSWLTSNLKCFDEGEYTGFYLFDEKYLWESFLHDNRSNEAYISQEAMLFMIASFGQCQFPSLYVKNDCSLYGQIVSYYSQQGFKTIIKKGL